MHIILDFQKKNIDFSCGDFRVWEDETSIYLCDGDTKFSPYVLLKYDKNNNSLLITSHPFGNGKNLFLSKGDEKYFFADSLKELKGICERPFKMNVGMLPHFMYNGFIAGTHTLVEGVYKMAAGTKVLIDKDGIHASQEDWSSYDDGEEFTSSCKVAENKYDIALKISIEKILEQIEKSDVESANVSDSRYTNKSVASIALSGGYDSNCILYNIKKTAPNIKVNAFCVGGISGVDETKVATKIADFYDGVELKSSFVSADTLTHLDEIVDILEGSVYERGIFLQYELGKLLSDSGVKYMICGECADQVFHEKTYENIPEDTFLYGYSDTPYQMAAYAVLRKNKMMLNHFGITPKYPFLTSEMISVGYATRLLNGKTKEFHKAQCRRTLPEFVTNLIGKQGGTTDLCALFENSKDVTRNIEKCKFYSKDFRITEKYSPDEAVMDYYLTLKYLESFERQFCDETK